jgi:hypothetical protein
MASQQAGVQAKNCEQYPNAISVHCYAHRLNLVLAHSATFINYVKVYFAALSVFRTYLPNPPKGLKHWIPTIWKDFLPSHLLDGSTIADLLKLCMNTEKELRDFFYLNRESRRMRCRSNFFSLLSLLRDLNFKFMLKKYFLQFFHTLTLFSKPYKLRDLI